MAVDIDTCRLEQEGEIETLKCIYSSDEFTNLDENTFEIKLTSELDEVDEYSNAGRYGLIIQFTYKPAYPFVPPLYELRSAYSTPEDVVNSISNAMETLLANYTGQVMIYDVCSEIQQILSDALGRVTDLSEGDCTTKEEAPAEIYGTMVTVETFMEWNKEFLAEITDLNIKKKSEIDPAKLTGRQLFERDEKLFLSDIQFFEDADGEDLDEPAVEIDESLFQDLGGLDLDDCD
ncbi:RWD domain-containing protein 1 isoform X1 [Oopsacas minuta]|uniref:RWD domain-containing protein 1 isoform X1 n=1 Tax=Oopsacas minuta TaxID=111878 RepID=A0AAV7K6V4_9METZ|nr:RWD domain-containing protein 1 isoform X1 [Oopsacas minuta]